MERLQDGSVYLGVHLAREQYTPDAAGAHVTL
jgi:hypothetical protein